jgi:hypothetical protein
MIKKTANGYIVVQNQNYNYGEPQMLGKKIEDYARNNITESDDNYGQFMYFAELIKRGHFNVFEKDVKTLSASYLKIIMDIVNGTNNV